MRDPFTSVFVRYIKLDTIRYRLVQKSRDGVLDVECLWKLWVVSLKQSAPRVAPAEYIPADLFLAGRSRDAGACFGVLVEP